MTTSALAPPFSPPQERRKRVTKQKKKPPPVMPFLCSRLSAPIPRFNCEDCAAYPASGHAIEVKPVASVTLRRSTWTLLPLVEASNVIPWPTCRPWRRWSGLRLDYAWISKSGGCCCRSEVGASDDYGEEVPENYDVTRLSTMGMTDKEMERRRKIGLANKGKVPWNVGRRHSDATRELIKQKTIEALRNPKVKSTLQVRKKMSEHPHTLSAYTKAKISSSQRRLWRERRKQKQLAENFFESWADNIAWVGKIGWKDEGPLEWDSYEKMKEEINIQHLRWREEKKRAKDMAKIRAQRAVVLRLQKMTMLAQKRKDREDREEKGKRKQEHRKPSSRQVKAKRHGDAVAEGINLKKRLMKIHRKRTTTIQIAGLGSTNTVAEIPSWEDVDLEHIRREKARRELTLADQIQAARSRAKVPYSEALEVPSSLHLLKGMEVK